jgi:hypothetical protein
MRDRSHLKVSRIMKPAKIANLIAFVLSRRPTSREVSLVLAMAD